MPICPLLSLGLYAGRLEESSTAAGGHCLRQGCQWWVSFARTGKGGDCALAALARIELQRFRDAGPPKKEE